MESMNAVQIAWADGKFCPKLKDLSYATAFMKKHRMGVDGL